MEREGCVSIWLGTCNAEQVAEENIFQRYSEEGELQPSWFTSVFQLERLNPDATEVAFHDEPIFPLELLQDISYEEQLLDAIKARLHLAGIEKANLAVLLYGFDHQGEVLDAQMPGVSLHFLGAFPYQD